MKRVSFGALAISLAVPASSYGGKPAARIEIEGSWQTACLPIGKNGRHGFITRLKITPSSITASSQSMLTAIAIRQPSGRTIVAP